MTDLTPAKVSRVMVAVSTTLRNEGITVNQATAILSYMAVQALVMTGNSREVAAMRVMTVLQQMEAIDEIPNLARYASSFNPPGGSGPTGGLTS